ncbi:putative bifunctional diguanylate cyclase/phosphodiesterase [Arabiibacter massiliensis]|uniref:putative bifunctional diguanylate cyclase/phosphodiesterase n=1 Tax=Arabiibacter massiliensis TaxID=1870985 RepID=UPI00155AF518|nr:bifunctional diguanylate cyclase/phosphodiesterase [Arabiibacter massiliensis]
MDAMLPRRGRGAFDGQDRETGGFGMKWNVSAEVIAFIIVCIIMVYSRKSHAVPSRKNRLFRICLVTTICAIGANLASTLMIAYAPAQLVPLTWVVTWVYFVLTPLLGAAYFYYAVAVVSEARPVAAWRIAVSTLPCVLYLVCALVDIPTGCLFSFDAAGVYQQGPLVLTTYLVFYFYCITCFVLVVFTRVPIDPSIKRILAVFPLIAVAVIAVQQAFPTYLLSGSAAACSLLIIYLYLQNKRLSVDLLTGVPNRQEFLSMVSLMHGAQQPFTAALVSLSSFKFVNDRFGHESGDRFLRGFAGFLEGLGGGVRVFRYSGDQFALIVDEAPARSGETARETAADVLETLRARLDEAWRVGGTSYNVSTAIGVVAYPAIARTPDEVVAALEYTTACSKELGPNVPCACTPEMMDAIHRRSDLTAVVRAAVADGGLSVHFQPIWSEEEGRFVAAEALCRLADGEMGPVSPEEFIPVAEKEGLITDLTAFVLDRSCAFVRAYRDAHPDTAFRGVSVNFSAVQFMQEDLADEVLGVVERHGIPPSCLRIELTESAIVANPEAVHAFMRRLREQGVRFYLDDFGTGFSNFSTILSLPVDIVKLDKSILWSASAGQGMQELLGMLEHLIAGFSCLGTKVLCEGVETERQREMLGRSGCELMQGYLFSRPLPPDEAASAIARSEADAEGAL